MPTGPGFLHSEFDIRNSKFPWPDLKEPSKALQERLIARKLLKSLQQHLHRVQRIRSGQRPPQRVHLRQDRLREQLLLLARAGLGDVDGGEDAALEEAAVEHDFRIAGSLELLKDHLVHARAGV